MNNSRPTIKEKVLSFVIKNKVRLAAAGAAITVAASGAAIYNGVTNKPVEETPRPGIEITDPNYNPSQSQNPTETPGKDQTVTPSEKPENTETIKPSDKPEETGKPENTQKPSEKPEETEKPHEHKYGKPVTKYESNKNGTHTKTVTKTCASCDDVQVVSSVSQNCNYKLTNTTDDLKTYSCKDCGHTKTQAHAYGAWKETSRKDNGNGTETITYTRSCSTCGHSMTKTETIEKVHVHNYETVSKGYEYQGADKHAYVVVEKCKDCGNVKRTPGNSLSCTYTGKKEISRKDNGNDTATVTYEETCSVCGHKHTFTETISIAHKHNFGAWVSTNKYHDNNDGTHSLIEERTCSSCGEKETRNNSKKLSCTYTGKKEISRSTSGNKVTITYEETCSVCGHKHTFTETKTITIPDPHSHSFSAWTATGSYHDNNDGTHSAVEQRTCSCGEKQTRNSSTKTACTYTGKKEISRKNNADGSVTITYEETCSVCGHKHTFTQTIGNSHSHSFSAWTATGSYHDNKDGTHSAVEQRNCSCGVSETRNSATKTPCTYTGKKEISRKDNGNETATVTYEETCSVCGHKHTFTEDINLGHSYGSWHGTGVLHNNEDGTHSEIEERVCSTCGDKQTRNSSTKTPCTFATYVKVPSSVSSNNAGSHSYQEKSTCVCGAEDIKNVTNESCHFSDWVKIGSAKQGTGATHTFDGKRTCSDCGYDEFDVDHFLESCSKVEQSRSGVHAVTSTSHGVDVTYQCSDCGKTFSETISEGCTFTEHVSGDVFKCSTCSNTTTKAHEWDDGVLDPSTGDTTYTCTNCGTTNVQTHTHVASGVDKGAGYDANGHWTNTDCMYCHTSMQMEGTYEPHNWDYDPSDVDKTTGEVWAECTECGYGADIVVSIPSKAPTTPESDSKRTPEKGNGEPTAGTSSEGTTTETGKAPEGETPTDPEPEEETPVNNGGEDDKENTPDTVEMEDGQLGLADYFGNEGDEDDKSKAPVVPTEDAAPAPETPNNGKSSEKDGEKDLGTGGPDPKDNKGEEVIPEPETHKAKAMSDEDMVAAYGALMDQVDVTYPTLDGGEESFTLRLKK